MPNKEQQQQQHYYGTFTSPRRRRSIEDVVKADVHACAPSPSAALLRPRKREPASAQQSACRERPRPSLWRRLLFWHFDELLATPAKLFDPTSGVRWPLEREFRSESVAAELKRKYATAQSKSLGRAILEMERANLVVGGAIAFCHVLVAASVPWLLVSTLARITSGAVTTVWRELLVLGACLVGETVCARHEAFQGEKSMVRIVTALQALVFEAALAVAAPDKDKESVPDVVHLIDNSAVVLGAAVARIHTAWSRVALLGVELYALVCVTQQRFVFVAATIAAISALLALATMAAARTRQRWLAAHNAVIATVHETLRGMRLVKLSAAERKAQRAIDAQCDAQDRLHLARDLAAALADTAVAAAAQLFSIALLASMAHRGADAFTPATALTALVLLHRIRARLFDVARCGSLFLRVVAAPSAIATFLKAHTVESVDASTSAAVCAMDGVIDIAIESSCFTRGAGASALLLVDATVRVQRGHLVVVHGASGTGKSALLRALVGELAPVSGAARVRTDRRVAYCAQEPWLETRSVRANIVFGAAWDARKYRAVLAACALLPDMLQLPRGDQTRVGPKGVNLSGGQRARIALARAAYADADVYILDAPLAAVDAVVQTHVFRACVLELLRRKTVILATHNPEIVRSQFVDQVVELAARTLHVTDHTRVGSSSRRVQAAAAATHAPWKPSAPIATTADTGLVLEPLDAETAALADQVDVAAAAAVAAEHLDTRATRTLPESVPAIATMRAIFSDRAVCWRALFAVLALVCATLLAAATDLWLVVWSAAARSSARSWTTGAAVYAMLVAATVACEVLGRAGASVALHRVSTRLFQRMTHALLHAPMAFYYTTPLGEVMYRYFIDLIAVDDAAVFAKLAASAAAVACRVAVIAYVSRAAGVTTACVAALALARVYPFVALYVPLRQVDLPDQWRNLDFMFAALDGAATIRAFGAVHVARFQRESGTLHDTSSQSALFDCAFGHFAAIRASPVAALQLLLLGAALSAAPPDGDASDVVSPAALGLVLYYSLAVCTSLDDCAHALASAQLGLLYAARVRAYGALESETSASSMTLAAAQLPSPWPSRGAVEFDRVWFRYPGDSASTHALTDVSCSVAGGQRIGVVGRTGSGKSSIAMALFRLHPIARGRVLIDGIDTRFVDLVTLRSRLTIIPELPMLFRGSVAQYLDPFREQDAAALWRALRACGLDTRVTSLTQELADNGENWSVGERQALGLARALLTPSRIVVLDEAFSGLDAQQATALLAVLERAFAHATVFLITHRLDQVLGFDKIMVLADGRLLEYGAAMELASDPSSAFYEFLETTLLTD